MRKRLDKIPGQLEKNKRKNHPSYGGVKGLTKDIKIPSTELIVGNFPNP